MQEPLLYLSRLTGAPMDIIVNWFILILVSVFDPLAVSLVIAANHLRHKEKEEEIIINKVESQITDAVTTPRIKDKIINKVNKNINLKKDEEKNNFDLKEEIVNFDENKNEQNEFYNESINRNSGYRRGVSL